MKLLSLLLMALGSLVHHKLRSFLTMLGMVFGVGAVVSMLAISEGGRREAMAAIQQMGLSNVLLKSVKPPAGQMENASKNKQNATLRYGLGFSDHRHLASILPDLERTVATRMVQQKVFNGGRRVDAEILATEPAYRGIAGLSVARGRFLCDLDMERRLPVAVLGPAVARGLFDFHDPLGQCLLIGEEYFQVVGILDPKTTTAGGTGKSADELNRSIYLPESAARAAFGITTIIREAGTWQRTHLEVADLILAFTPGADVIQAAKLARHSLDRTQARQDVAITVPRELMEEKRRAQHLFAIIMGSIAGISLLVGGIGIMNIMLATVLERTREIGVRRALGATRSDIVAQFLVETVVLCALGGLAGLAVGTGGAVAVSRLAGWATAITPWSVALSVGIAGAVGVVFGLYPAIKAARMQPVEALRWE